ncbi:hypothetical protein C1142_10680 [Clostridium botulinum]|nr:hypothetical protein C1142_10680 [Clostridium botulinum]RUT59988.1 hypothetical protein C1148_01630 [Clostridium botulinum]RUT62477.1 hypothetical protein C1143_04905 [Clostridium botulinum]
MKKYAGIQYVVPDNFQSIVEKQDKITKTKEFVKYEMNDNIKNVKLQSSHDRLGYYIFAADTREELMHQFKFYK